MLTPDPSTFRRDANPTLVCACGHDDTSHRHDLARTSPCDLGACGCMHFRPAKRRWRWSAVTIEEM